MRSPTLPYIGCYMSPPPIQISDKFTFRKHASIGAAAAEEDTKFLAECFVDNGDLEPLIDCADRRRIILGRTGAGKSALLNKLIEETGAIVINPETLAFNFLTNSTVLQFFLEAGVKLDLFFKLLWRHVFTVELLRNRYELKSKADSTNFLEKIKGIVARDVHKERAIRYLLQWGDQFWENTEYRIKEITHRIEEDLKASVRGKFSLVELGAGGAAKLTEEEKGEVVQRGKVVINAIQMRELTDVLTFLNEDVFPDENSGSTYVSTVSMKTGSMKAFDISLYEALLKQYEIFSKSGTSRLLLSFVRTLSSEYFDSRGIRASKRRSIGVCISP